MWGFKRQSSTTPTPQPSTPRRDLLEKAFIDQSKALVEVIKQQQATLDRIVMAKYDRPVERAQAPQVSEQMPLWGMNDQGDSRPDPEAAEIEHQLSRIATATDSEWVTGA